MRTQLPLLNVSSSILFAFSKFPNSFRLISNKIRFGKNHFNYKKEALLLKSGFKDKITIYIVTSL